MIINYKCEKCQATSAKYFKKSKEIKDDFPCKCGSILERQLGAPNTKSTQYVDDGLHPRRVEVSSEVVEQERKKLYKE